MEHHALVAALLETLFPASDSWSVALDRAIRTEILLAALEHSSQPRTLVELAGALERVGYRGAVARELTDVVLAHASRAPGSSIEEVLTGSLDDRRL